MSVDPMAQLLAGLYLGLDIIAGRKCGDKHRCLERFAGLRVDQGQGQPGVIHFHDLTPTVWEPPGGRLCFRPTPVILTELGVCVSCGVLIPVLDPQQLERYLFFFSSLRMVSQSGSGRSASTGLTFSGNIFRQSSSSPIPSGSGQ